MTATTMLIVEGILPGVPVPSLVGADLERRGEADGRGRCQSFSRTVEHPLCAAGVIRPTIGGLGHVRPPASRDIPVTL